MFEFEKEQKVFNIGNVKIGGSLGENPTTMIGSIFYKGDKIVKDSQTGEFDGNRAKDLINKVEEAADRTGLSSMLDVVCTNAHTADKYIEFVADATDMPILIDAVTEESAVKGIEKAKELNIIDRTVFNSISPETSETVCSKIREAGLKNAILLTYSARAILSSQERVKLLDKLIPKAEKAGARNLLIDTVVMDIATLGLACKALFQIKNKYGYPAGCGAHNAIESWRSLKRINDKMLNFTCSAVANGLPIALGADFVLYGPIAVAEYMFPAVSIIDASFGQIMMEKGKRPSLNHPRFKIARL